MFVLRSNNSGFSLHIVLIVLAALTGAVIIGLYTKSQIEINSEEKQFISAQQDVNSLGEQIAKTTNPDKQQAVSYCDYGHVKYGQGGRTCWAQYYLLYKNTTYDKGIEALVKNQALFPNSKLRPTGTIESEKFTRSISFKTDGFNGYCNAIAYFNNDPEYATYSKSSLGLPFDTEPKDAILQIDCSGEAKAEHFPVKE